MDTPKKTSKTPSGNEVGSSELGFKSQRSERMTVGSAGGIRCSLHGTQDPRDFDRGAVSIRQEKKELRGNERLELRIWVSRRPNSTKEKRAKWKCRTLRAPPMDTDNSSVAISFEMPMMVAGPEGRRRRGRED